MKRVFFFLFVAALSMGNAWGAINCAPTFVNVAMDPSPDPNQDPSVRYDRGTKFSMNVNCSSSGGIAYQLNGITYPGGQNPKTSSTNAMEYAATTPGRAYLSYTARETGQCEQTLNCGTSIKAAGALIRGAILSGVPVSTTTFKYVPAVGTGSVGISTFDDQMTYTFSLTKKPEGSLARFPERSDELSFFVPDYPGDYEVQLQTRDRTGHEDAVRKTVSVTGPGPEGVCPPIFPPS